MLKYENDFHLTGEHFILGKVTFLKFGGIKKVAIISEICMKWLLHVEVFHKYENNYLVTCL